MIDNACEKCGGSLYVDREAVLEVARRGLRGGRVFCVAGCTEVWLIKPAGPTIERAVPRPDGRGKYLRTVRTLSCRICKRPYQTRGTKPGRCKACRTAAGRARDRLRRRPSLQFPGRSPQSGMSAAVATPADSNEPKSESR